MTLESTVKGKPNALEAIAMVVYCLTPAVIVFFLYWTWQWTGMGLPDSQTPPAATEHIHSFLETLMSLSGKGITHFWYIAAPIGAIAAADLFKRIKTRNLGQPH